MLGLQCIHRIELTIRARFDNAEQKESGQGLLRSLLGQKLLDALVLLFAVNDKTIPNQLQIRFFGRYPRFTMFGCRGAAVGMLEHKGRLVI